MAMLRYGVWLLTVGRVPLEWYRHEDHIGYDLDANKIMTKKKDDRLEALLARNDSGKALRTIYDEYNDEEIVLSRQELELVQRIREGKFPHVEVGPSSMVVPHKCCSNLHKQGRPQYLYVHR